MVKKISVTPKKGSRKTAWGISLLISIVAMAGMTPSGVSGGVDGFEPHYIMAGDPGCVGMIYSSYGSPESDEDSHDHLPDGNVFLPEVIYEEDDGSNGLCGVALVSFGDDHTCHTGNAVATHTPDGKDVVMATATKSACHAKPEVGAYVTMDYVYDENSKKKDRWFFQLTLTGGVPNKQKSITINDRFNEHDAAAGGLGMAISYPEAGAGVHNGLAELYVKLERRSWCLCTDWTPVEDSDAAEITVVGSPI